MQMLSRWHIQSVSAMNEQGTRSHRLGLPVASSVALGAAAAGTA
jgi:hypothetical protein